VNDVTDSPRPETQEIRHERDRYSATRRVTLVGGLINGLLGIAKVIGGYLAGSQALIADGVHSLSDLATDAGVLFAAREASRDADAEHPYGHGRFETVATVGLSAVLVFVALGIAWDAVQRLLQPEALLRPGPAALVVALVSIGAKEALYHYTQRAARRFRSQLLHANAWHHRSDAVSSIIVVAGLLGVMAGLEYLDAVAAIAVAALIGRIAWKLAADAMSELVDAGLDPEQTEALRDKILSVNGVRDMHMLRTRRMGGRALVDVHIQVPSSISVSEGHQISEHVRLALIREFDEVTDVTVHIDPEDDEQALASIALPDRAAVVARLQRLFAGIPAAGRIERITLHYLAGRLRIELLLPLAAAADEDNRATLAERLRDAVRGEPDIATLDVHYH
jgi:cation diffusion facilitator family transporter